MLHRSHRSMTDSSLLNILYHNCTSRCLCESHCLCKLHCQNIRCMVSNLCRNGFVDNKLAKCQCRTTWRSLQHIKLIYIVFLTWSLSFYLDTLLDASTNTQCRFRALQLSNDIAVLLLWCRCTASPESQPVELRSSCNFLISFLPTERRLRHVFHVVFFLIPESWW